MQFNQYIQGLAISLAAFACQSSGKTELNGQAQARGTGIMQ